MSENHVSPPYGNTGVVNTSPISQRALVDWVQVTFLDCQFPEELVQFFHFDLNDFQEMKTGNYGYHKSLRYGNIVFYFGGNPVYDSYNQEWRELGVHLEMTGQGCREFEQMNNLSWSQFFTMLNAYNHNVTRIDLAIDEFTGLITTRKILSKVRNQLVTSKFKKVKNIEDITIKNGETTGHTLYFGRPSSNIQIRFYDKYQERLERGYEVEEWIKQWTRVEIQARDEHAQMIAQIISVAPDNIGSTVKGTLANYISFKQKGNDKNRSRLKECRWWTQFLNGVDKLKLSQSAPDRTIEKTADWLSNQVEPSTAITYLAFKEDFDMFEALLKGGLERVKDKHKDMLLRYYRKHHSGKEITFVDIEKMIDKELEKLHKKKNAMNGEQTETN
ncbi:replication initiation factor domain-containing protein [Cellulomonas biazotea]|uniref:replication initiation factor domain-containing protein n=1 Tax=Cellulomonas biazotea TaxID=1709 RepID=UPI0035E66C1F